MISSLIKDDTDKKYEDYNQELVDPIADILLFLGVISFMVSIFFCFACYKYRNFAKVLFYFECISATIFTMMSKESQTNLKTFFVWLVLLFCFYTDSANQIIFGIVTLAFQLFIVLPFFLLNDVHGLSLATDVVLLIEFFIIATIFGMFSSFVLQMYLH